METLNRLEASVEKESEEMAEAYVKDEELSSTSIDFWGRHRPAPQGGSPLRFCRAIPFSFAGPGP